MKKTKVKPFSLASNFLVVKAVCQAVYKALLKGYLNRKSLNIKKYKTYQAFFNNTAIIKTL
jgi:uncharacterized membrane protein SirB2